MYKLLITILVFAISFSLFASSNTYAQSATNSAETDSEQRTATSDTQTDTTQIIRVSPIIMRLSLSPGTTQVQTIKVENLLDQPLPLQASVESFDASDEEYGIAVNSKPEEQSPLLQWITIDQKDTIIPAKESREFKISVNVPREVPIGGYYALVFFTPILATGEIPISSKVGVFILANIGIPDNTRNSAEIATFELGGFFVNKGPIDALLRVKNTSLNYFTVKPYLTISPILINKGKSYDMEEKTILPGKTRRWHNEFKIAPIGIYKAKLAVSVGNGDQIYKTAYFVAFPFTKVLITLISLITLAYVIKHKSRIRKALRLLVRGQ